LRSNENIAMRNQTGTQRLPIAGAVVETGAF